MKNSSTEENKFAFYIVISLIFIAALMIWYLLFFFLTRNQELWYNSWQNSKTLFFMHCCSISTTTDSKIFDILNSEYCYVLCSTVLISCSNVISECIFLIVLKSQLRTCSWFIKHLIRSSYSYINSFKLIISFFIQSDVSLASTVSSEKHKIN